MRKGIEKDIDSFYELVPIGTENGLSCAELARRARMSERDAREMISKVNASGRGMIINLSDRNGYFRASEEEKEKEYKYRRQEQNRFVSLKEKLEGMNKYLGSNHPKKKDPLDDMQMDIFQYIGDEDGL